MHAAEKRGVSVAVRTTLDDLEKRSWACSMPAGLPRSQSRPSSTPRATAKSPKRSLERSALGRTVYYEDIASVVLGHVEPRRPFVRTRVGVALPSGDRERNLLPENLSQPRDLAPPLIRLPGLVAVELVLDDLLRARIVIERGVDR